MVPKPNTAAGSTEPILPVEYEESIMAGITIETLVSDEDKMI